MRLPVRVALVSFVLALTACATAYHPENSAGGYGETQLAPNVFRVTFKGNVASRQADTDEMALLRAAQVARDHGFPFFVSSGAAPIGTAASLATNVVSAPGSTLTITCFRTRPQTDAVVYESERVIATSGAKFDRPAP